MIEDTQGIYYLDADYLYIIQDSKHIFLTQGLYPPLLDLQTLLLKNFTFV